MKNPFSSWFKPQKDLEFVDTKRLSYHNFTVERACDVKANTYRPQLEKYGKHIMPGCPGILDYSQYGYIIPAWVDIHIFANKAGVSWYIGDKGSRGDRGFDNGSAMDHRLVDGAFEVENVPPTAILFPSPWKIFARRDISAMVMPATYHGSHFEDLHIIQGIVDYNKFHAVNFICMPKRECEVHIKAGEPLLHVMPFLNTPITASVGPGTEEQVDKVKNLIPGDDKQYYRKFMRTKKVFKINQESEQ